MHTSSKNTKQTTIENAAKIIVQNVAMIPWWYKKSFLVPVVVVARLKFLLI